MGSAATGVSEQLVGAGTALAGLILVFLGSTVTAYDSYDATQRRSVQGKYRHRALLSFAGFILALAAATSGLVSILLAAPSWERIGLIALWLAFVVTVIAAWLVVSDLL